MEMEKDKLLRNLPVEMLTKLRALADRMWAENNVVAVPLWAMIEELEAEVEASGSVLSNYDNYFKERLESQKQAQAAMKERFEHEIAGLKGLIAGLEASSKENVAKLNELRLALEKSENQSREKYSKDEVNLLERQILDLKKEINEFHQLKELDDRRIMELEGQVATKAEEVERRFIAKVGLLGTENAELKKQNSELEKAKIEDDAKIKELHTALEKSERISREKYTREEVDLIERQILDLKKELNEFRQLKEMDDRRIMELEGELGTKSAEVEKRFIARVSQLEKDNAELRKQNEEYEQAKVEDDSRIKQLRSSLEKSERESREKYTRSEVDMLEQQILELKKEIREMHQLKELDDRRAAELEAQLAEKTDGIENKYIGRINLLEKKNEELIGYCDELEKTKSAAESRAAELKKTVALKDKEISERYQEEDVKKLEEIISSLRSEMDILKGKKLEDERKLADLERSLGEKRDGIEEKYFSQISALESQVAELKGNISALESDNSALAEKLSGVKKSIINRDHELLELKTRLSDAELEFGEKLAEKERELEKENSLFKEKMEADARRVQSEYAQKLKALEARKMDMEADFTAKKMELIKTFDKVREEMELREKVLAARESKTEGS